MTTIDRLDGWKAVGVISDEQHAMLTALVRRERFSVFVELSALLYLGVLSIVGGLVWTFRDYVASLGDVAILSILALLMALAFGYCFTRTASVFERRSRIAVAGLRLRPLLRLPGVFRDARLHRNPLRDLPGVGHASAGWRRCVFGALAYRFDNRFVLSLALSTLAGYLGLKLAIFDALDSDRARLVGMMYGGVSDRRWPAAGPPVDQAAFSRRLPAARRQRDPARGDLRRARAGHRPRLSGGAADPVGGRDLSRRAPPPLCVRRLRHARMAMPASARGCSTSSAARRSACSTSSSPAPSS